jgi:DNA-binding NtrC family response regulator
MDYTILIIDDELEMCLSLSELLNDEGYRTLYTINPRETADILRDEKIDLVIMDIKMPEIEGIELLQNLQKQGTSIAAIMITGYPSEEDIAQAMKYGAVNVYTKPLSLSDMLDEIHELAAQS